MWHALQIKVIPMAWFFLHWERCFLFIKGWRILSIPSVHPVKSSHAGQGRLPRVDALDINFTEKYLRYTVTTSMPLKALSSSFQEVCLRKWWMLFDKCEGEQPLEVLTYYRDLHPSSLCSQTLDCPLSINEAEV